MSFTITIDRITPVVRAGAEGSIGMADIAEFIAARLGRRAWI
jgi:hypothetical protein